MNNNENAIDVNDATRGEFSGRLLFLRLLLFISDAATSCAV
jgi:hypothetical protein